MIPITRRAFLQTTGGALALSAAAPIAPPLSVFPYGAVELLGGPMKKQFDENHRFFLNLSEDRLLKIYRQRVGLPAPGDNMGGWYDDFCPGAHFGQYVSALARFAAATNSEPTRAKVRRLVNGYAKTLDGPRNFFEDLRYPGYTYDKLVCGLMDAHSYAGDTSAIKVLYATTDAAKPHFPNRALTLEEQHSQPAKDDSYRSDETYTMAENLFIAYERTGDRMFFDMGRRYLLDRTFFDPLAAGENILPGLHAYSHMNALSSGMQGYLKLGDAKYLRAVTNAVDMIWKDQSFATGGWGPNEAFVEPGKGMLGASLADTWRSFETPCGSYAHFKAMRYLLTLTRDVRYGDSMERVLLNTVLGALPVQEDGSCFYYSNYRASATKSYKRDIEGATAAWDHDGRWACCSGTLPQVAADAVINAYFRAQDGVYVNLYCPSRLTWTMGSAHCVLTQKTAYPTGDSASFTLELASPAEFALYFRVPGWAGKHTSFSVNGKRLTTAAEPGTFFPIRRTWKSGDIVDFEIDQPLRIEPVDKQTPDQVAVMRGPQVLFAIDEQQPTLSREQALRLQLTRAGANDWTGNVGARKVLLRPFPSIGEEVYQTYWKLGASG
jgi:DUF1680 family protein